MRLFMGILAAQKFESILTGDSSLVERPMDRVADPLIKMGANIETSSGRAPINIFPSVSFTNSYGRKTESRCRLGHK